MEMVFRLAFSLVMQILLELISDEKILQSKSQAYIFAFGCGLLWLAGQLSRHNAFYKIFILSGRIRFELLFIIYIKLSKLSFYTAKSQELGKIMNMVSNDLNTI